MKVIEGHEGMRDLVARCAPLYGLIVRWIWFVHNERLGWRRNVPTVAAVTPGCCCRLRVNTVQGAAHRLATCAAFHVADQKKGCCVILGTRSPHTTETACGAIRWDMNYRISEVHPSEFDVGDSGGCSQRSVCAVKVSSSGLKAVFLLCFRGKPLQYKKLLYLLST